MGRSRQLIVQQSKNELKKKRRVQDNASLFAANFPSISTEFSPTFSKIHRQLKMRLRHSLQLLMALYPLDGSPPTSSRSSEPTSMVQPPYSKDASTQHKSVRERTSPEAPRL